jgi:hypothetical protein
MKRIRVMLDFVVGSIEGEDHEIDAKSIQEFRDRAVEVARSCEGTAMWSDDLPVYVESLNINTAVLDGDDSPSSKMPMSNSGLKEVEQKYENLLREDGIKVGGKKDGLRQVFFFAGAIEAIKTFAPHFIPSQYWLVMLLSGRSILEDRKKNNHE